MKFHFFYDPTYDLYDFAVYSYKKRRRFYNAYAFSIEFRGDFDSCDLQKKILYKNYKLSKKSIKVFKCL